MTSTLRICMLNAEEVPPTVLSKRGPTFGRIFHELLANASPNIKIESKDFDVKQLEYPEQIDDFDAIVISGSANASYDKEPWILKLGDYIWDVYHHHPQVRIFGSCFGHQLVCQVLLKEYGVKVDLDPKGYEIGVKEITLDRQFRDAFGKSSDGSFGEVEETMRMQFIHHDHVVIPNRESLPATWTVLGSTEHCAVQGVYEPGRVLTYQGHFEFDRFINSEVIKTFFASSWEPAAVQAALDDIDADDDAIYAARLIMDFFVAGQAKFNHTSATGVGNEIAPHTEEDHRVSISVES